MGAEGVKWVSNNSSPTLTRYHGAAGANTQYSPASQAVATTYFSGLAPWGSMGRLSLRPDGSVSSRCLTNQTSLQTAANWGDNCYSDTDQTGGEQKMVYIPQFCYAVDVLTPNQVWWWVGQVGDQFYKSDSSGTYTFSTSDIHPAFIVDGVAKSAAYIGAYEGYNSSSVLQSVAGVTPTVSTSKPNLRTYAENIGTGWELSTLQMYGALQYLYTIEYASLNSQESLGRGNTNSSAMVNTGYTTSNGNASYGTTANYTTPMSYRGVENLWGNVYKYVEGFRTDASVNVWIAAQTAAHTYSDVSTLTGGQGTAVGPYVNTASVPSVTWGYINTIFTTTGTYGLSWVFLAATESGGSATTYFCDETNATASRCGSFGGNWAPGGSGTAGGVYMVYGAIYTGGSTVAARLQYFPQ